MSELKTWGKTAKVVTKAIVTTGVVVVGIIGKFAKDSADDMQKRKDVDAANDTLNTKGNKWFKTKQDKEDIKNAWDTKKAYQNSGK